MLESPCIDIKPGSERSFGLIFGIVFILIGLFPLLEDGAIRYWSLIVAAACIGFALFLPSVLKRPNIGWFKLGLFLGGIIAPIVMAIVYILTIIPTGLFFRLMGKDPLKIKLDPKAKTYWIKRETPLQPMKRQF